MVLLTKLQKAAKPFHVALSHKYIKDTLKSEVLGRVMQTEYTGNVLAYEYNGTSDSAGEYSQWRFEN